MSATLATDVHGDGDRGLHLFVWRGLLLRLPEAVQPPKAGTLFVCRHVAVRPGERVLEIGGGAGLFALLAARTGAAVTATDVVPEAVDAIAANAALNGLTVAVRQGDGYAPVERERFDLVCANPPQMPTPRDLLARADVAAAADNGGVDGWALLDRIIAGAPDHLRTGGRLVVSLFAFLGVARGLGRLREAGLEPRVIARETQPFPRLGFERLEHLRACDTEDVVPRDRIPDSVDRVLVEGRLPAGGA